MTLSAFGVNFLSAVITSLSALTNSGPALLYLSEINVDFAILPPGAKFSIMIGMLLGRIELLAFFVLLNFSFWRP